MNHPKSHTPVNSIVTPILGVASTIRKGHTIQVDFTTFEGWENVAATQHITRINETKGILVRHGREADAIESAVCPAGRAPNIDKPPHPQKVQPPRAIVKHPRPSIDHIYMVDPKDTGI
jgi:hypothetical protein